MQLLVSRSMYTINDDQKLSEINVFMVVISDQGERNVEKLIRLF